MQARVTSSLKTLILSLCFFGSASLFSQEVQWQIDFQQMLELSAHPVHTAAPISRLPVVGHVGRPTRRFQRLSRNRKERLTSDNGGQNHNFIFGDSEFPWLTDEGLMQAQLLEPEDGERAGEGRDPEDTTLGDAPEDTSQVFLRRDAVLMTRGSWEVDWGLAFAMAEDEIPLLIQNEQITAVAELTMERRVLMAPLAFRYGLADRLQFLCNVPLGWANSRAIVSSADDHDNIVGIGDVTLGVSTLVYKGSKNKPQMIVTFNAVAPTANPSFPTFSTLAREAALGSGHWGLGTRAIFVQKVAPIVVFYGFGYQQLLAEDFAIVGSPERVFIQPGAIATYQLGVGFSASSKVNLNASMQGSYIAESRRDGVGIPGSSQQPLNLRLSTTIRTADYVVEPFAQFSVSGRSSAQFGISWTYASKRKPQQR